MMYTTVRFILTILFVVGVQANVQADHHHETSHGKAEFQLASMDVEKEMMALKDLMDTMPDSTSEEKEMIKESLKEKVKEVDEETVEDYFQEEATQDNEMWGEKEAMEEQVEDAVKEAEEYIDVEEEGDFIKGYGLSDTDMDVDTKEQELIQEIEEDTEMKEEKDTYSQGYGMALDTEPANEKVGEYVSGMTDYTEKADNEDKTALTEKKEEMKVIEADVKDKMQEGYEYSNKDMNIQKESYSIKPVEGENDVTDRSSSKANVMQEEDDFSVTINDEIDDFAADAREEMEVIEDVIEEYQLGDEDTEKKLDLDENASVGINIGAY